MFLPRSKSSSTVYPRYQKTAKLFSALYNGTRLADFVVTKDYALVLVIKKKRKTRSGRPTVFILFNGIKGDASRCGVFCEEEVSINIIP